MKYSKEHVLQRRWVWLGIAAMSVANWGCFDTKTVRCEGGLRCPPGSVCVEGAHQCATPSTEEAVLACVGLFEGESCELSAELSVCRGGLCTLSTCGNQYIDPNEQCDGTPVGGYECSSDCLLEVCGNGIVDPGEECDCGNGSDSFGPQESRCEKSLNSDVSGFCRANCMHHCGDGILSSHEACDIAQETVGYCTDAGYDFGILSCSTACDVKMTDGCGLWNIQEMMLPLVTDPDTIVARAPMIDSIWGANSTNVFAAGAKGEVLQYDGSIWREVYNFFGTPSVSSIWVDSDGYVIASSDRDFVYYDGEEWTVENSVTNGRVVDIWGSGKGNVFAVAQNSGISEIYHYDGEAWQMVRAEPGFWGGVWGSGPTSVYVVGGEFESAGYGSIVHYDGVKWEQVFESDVRFVDVWGSADDNIFFTSEDGVLHYDGKQWEWMHGTVASARIWGNSDDDVFAIGFSNGARVVQHYDGVEWQVVPLDVRITDEIVALWGDGEDLFMGGWRTDDVNVISGLVYRYYGESLREHLFPIYSSLTDVWGSDSSNIFAVSGTTQDWGGSRTIIRYDGNDWSEMVHSYDVVLEGVWGTAADNVYTVGHNGSDEVGVILHYDGDSWRSVDLPESVKSLVGIWGSGADDIFVVGSGGTVIHFDGQLWSHMEVPTKGYLASVWGSSASNVFAVGSGGMIIHWDGSSWQRMERPDGAVSGVELNDVWGSGPNDIYAVNQGGQILHYDGNIWSIADDPEPGRVLRAISGSSHDDVFAVGRDGIMLHYDGERWSPMRSGTNRALEDIWVSSRHRSVIVGQRGTILHRR